MARTGRPWRDFKPPPSAPVWAIIQGFGSYWTLVAAHRSRRVRRGRSARSDHDRAVGRAPRRIGAAPAARVRCARQLRVPRPGRRGVRADRDGRALPVHRRSGVDGRAGAGRARTVAQLGVARRHGANRRGGVADRGRPGCVLRTARHRDVRDPAARRESIGAAARLGAATGIACARPRRRTRAVGDRRARAIDPAARPSSTTSPGSSSWPRRRSPNAGWANVSRSGRATSIDIELEPGGIRHRRAWVTCAAPKATTVRRRWCAGRSTHCDPAGRC